MSRTKANKEISKQGMKAVLKEHGVTMIGDGKDEAPMVYKNRLLDDLNIKHDNPRLSLSDTKEGKLPY
jgi:hypothetical protein